MTNISIAMATFNGARFIREQLDSLAMQSVLPFELTVTDDGSTDGTLTILSDFAKVAPFPVEIHRNPDRLGYGMNFMKCASLCGGDAIAFCDQDDIWHPKKLEMCKHALRQEEVCMVYHNADIFVDGGRVLKRLYARRDHVRMMEKFKRPDSFCAAGFTIVFKSFLREYGDIWRSLNAYRGYGAANRPLAHDQWITYVASMSGRIFYLEVSLAQYRMHANNAILNNDSALATLRKYFRASALRAHNSSKLYSILAELLLSDGVRAPEKFQNSAIILQQLASWMELRFHLYSDRTFFGRVATQSKLFAGGAYKAKEHGGLGWNSMLKDISLGLILGGFALLAERIAIGMRHLSGNAK
jgi:glycosyltransferase involved in cell wall biosynthesis